jgi:hypothetical protein
LPPREAPEKSTAPLEADLIRVMDEMFARERAGTPGGPARRAQGAEIARRRRTVVWYCATLVFAVLALTIVMVR